MIFFKNFFKPAWMKDDWNAAKDAVALLKDYESIFSNNNYTKKWIDIATNCPHEDLRIVAILHLFKKKENLELSKTIINNINNENFLIKVINAIVETGIFELSCSLFDSLSKKYQKIAYTKAIYYYAEKWSNPLTARELNCSSAQMHRLVNGSRILKNTLPKDVQSILNNKKNDFLSIKMQEERDANKCPAQMNGQHQYVYVEGNIFQLENGAFKKKITNRCKFCGRTYSYEEYD